MTSKTLEKAEATDRHQIGAWAIFNMIGPYFEAVVSWISYAGSGGLSIEAVKRNCPMLSWWNRIEGHKLSSLPIR